MKQSTKISTSKRLLIMLILMQAFTTLPVVWRGYS